MAEITLKGVTKRYPDGTEAVKAIDLDIADGEFMILVGPVGLRQVDGPADDRRARGHLRRRADHRRRGRQRPRPEGPGHRDGVPELRAVSAHDGPRQHGLRAQAGQDRQGGDRPEGRGGRTDPRPRGASRAQAGQPVGRPAPARGDGPRDRARPARVPDGRAAVEPRREAARADAHRGGADPAAGGHDDGLRDPRPDRGDDAGRPRGRDARGQDPAGRLAEGALRRPGEPVRGGLHRVAGDELPAGEDRGRQREAAVRRRAAAGRRSRTRSAAGRAT